MDDCLFCKIIKGEIPSYTIYENEYVKAFLDIGPVSKGHTLIIPKKHFRDINDIDLETLTHIDEAAKIIIPMLKEKLGCDGVTRIQNNGYGQEIKHYHLHLIPRYENDSINIPENKEEVANVQNIYKNFN